MGSSAQGNNASHIVVGSRIHISRLVKSGHALDNRFEHVVKVLGHLPGGPEVGLQHPAAGLEGIDT
jgi:hypothetical protein